MGLHYSQRTYYDDPKENEDFIKYYASSIYCRHGQPSYAICHRCRCENREKRYEDYCKKKRINFMKYFNDQYDYYFNNPSLQTENVMEPRPDDKFIKLKKSNSQEELKKEYHKLAKKLHPDKPTGSTKLFQKLSQIYELLKSTLHH